MKKVISLIGILMLVGVLLCACTGKAGLSGTYYLYSDGDMDKSQYFSFDKKGWTDDDGASGTYEMNGDNITLYSELFGEQIEICSGTFKEGVLTFKIAGTTYTYCKEGNIPKNPSGNDPSTDLPSQETFTVTYDANGGYFEGDKTTYEQKVKGNTTLTAPSSPSRNGYTFAGWAKDKKGGEMWKFASDKVTSDVKLYASWAQQSAAILSVDGASIDGDEIFMLVDHTTKSVSLSDKVVCSDDSYWELYYDQMGQVKIPTKMAASTSGELDDGDNIFYILVSSQNGVQQNVYKLLVHRSYLIDIIYTFNNSVIETDSAYTGRVYNVTYVPSIKGYTFNYWKTSDNSKATQFTPYKPVTLKADATANKYTITLDVNGGETLSQTTKEVTFDKSYTLTVPTREGHTFEGWYSRNTQYTDKDGSSLIVYSDDKNITLTAKWTVNTYKVMVNTVGDGGTVEGAGEYVYGKKVTLTATIKNGYVWLGWFDKNTLLTDELNYNFTMGLSKTLTAKWIKCPVTVERNNSGAGTVSSLNGKYKVGDDATITATTYAGYTWVGWYKGETKVSDELEYTFKMPSENVTYTAKWIKVSLSRSDNSAGAISSLNDKYKAGQSVTITAETNSGYTFLGWFNGKTKLSDELEYTFKMPSENVTYTATWIKCPVILEKNINEAGLVSGVDNTTVGKDATITAKTYLGYTWVGWYKGETKVTDQLEYTFKMLSENVTYTAKWKISEDIRDFEFTSTASTCTITEVKDEAKTKTELTVPDYVTEIKEGAFYDCGSLQSLTLPFVGGSKDKTTASSSTLFGYIFGKSSYLGGVKTKQFYGSRDTDYLYYYIPKSLTKVTITGGDKLYRAFYNCSGLTSITIGDSVTTIGESAFKYCSGLTSITIGDSVTTIGESAFKYCSGLTSITIGDSVTSIGRGAFEDCSGLTRVNINDLSSWCKIDFGNYIANPLYYAKHLYQNGQEITNLVIPQDITEIKAYAFYKCTGLTSVTIPNSVTTIGSAAFDGCSGLTSVTIGDSVTTIGSAAFDGCSGLTSIVIPDSVTTIGESAFSGCDSLQSITLPFVGANKDQTGATYFGYIFGASEYFQNSSYVPKSLKTVIISNAATSIGNYAFRNCSGLTSITIGDSVTTIGNYAFLNCSGLTSVTIGNSVTTIGYSAFSGCSGLTSVTIPDSVTSIGYYAFENCSGLTSIVIPNSVTTIGEYAFSDCSGLTSVTIGSGVKTIGYSAFRDCSGLTSVTIPDSVTTIGSSAFYGCSSLETITLPFVGANIKQTNNTHFGYIFGASTSSDNDEYVPQSLKTVIISDAATSIGNYAFSGCSKLTSVTIGESVTSIGKYAFRGCSGLTEITIPDSVTSIGDDAFLNCSGLTSVTIGSGVKTIGNSAFLGCSGLKSVEFKNPDNWQVSYYSSFSSPTSISDLSDSSTAARYLRNTYYNYSWRRTE